MGKAVLANNLLGTVTPINIMWRITNKCNSRCEYCRIWKREQNELSTEQVFSLIDQMYHAGTLRIGFVGGEALLRPDFAEIVQYAKSKSIYLTLVSNGILVPKKMSIIKNIDCLVLSFDGKKRNHERGRCKGSFGKLMQAFEACKRNKINLLTITVLNKHNLQDIDFVLEKAKKYGFRCNFHLLQGGWECYPSDQQYRQALDYLIARKKQGSPIAMSLRCLRFLREWPDYKKFFSKEKMPGFRCYAGKLFFNIDTDGSIAGCDVLSNMHKNPDCVKLGLRQACNIVDRHGCEACTCVATIEYSSMFSLKADVITDWVRVVFSTRTKFFK
ncbi:MAG: radical SAM protein [Candidatus Woesearchaeota archaeon]